MTFRGRILKIAGDAFVEVVTPPSDGTVGSGARIRLGLMPVNQSGVQSFNLVEGKAYPTHGLANSLNTAGVQDRPLPSSSGGMERWSWQKEALGKWRAAGCKGIIEAVTGSGKTFLAIEGWRQQLDRHLLTYTLVVVPSITLQQQWHERITQRFPGVRVGLIGNNHQDSFAHGKICIAVVNSVVGVGRRASEARLHSLFAHCRRHRENRAFLIADECHHYIHAEVFRRVRTEVRFDAILALSATVGEQYAVEGLGPIVYTYTFADAIRRGDLPPLTLLNVSCRLHSDERHAYDQYTEKISEQMDQVKELFAEELGEDEFNEDFFRKLKQIDQAAGPKGQPDIRRLLHLLFKRASLLYQARDKQSAARELIKELLSSGRRKLIIFFERIASAEEGAESLEIEAAANIRHDVARPAIWTGILHSGLSELERERALAEFRATPHGILFACRMLDEGFDVPDVDAAVLVASTKSKRQRIQRVGRVLRRGDGAKQPVVATLFCDQTTDQQVVAEDKALFGEDTGVHRLTPSGATHWLRQHPLTR